MPWFFSLFDVKGPGPKPERPVESFKYVRDSVSLD